MMHAYRNLFARKPLWIGCVAVGIAVAILLYRNNVSHSVHAGPKPGDCCYLSDDGKEYVIVTTDRDIYRRYQQLEEAKDILGVMELVKNGSAFKVKVGENIRVIQGDTISEVRITSGDQQGKSGYVASDKLVSYSMPFPSMENPSMEDR